MRLIIPLCLSFLGALASFSSVSAKATYGHRYQLAERNADLISMRDAGLLDLRDYDTLEIRDEDHLDMRDDGLLDIRDVEDLYELLVRRAKITAAQAATRKAAGAAAANKRGKAPHATTPKPKGAKVKGKPKHPNQVAADARKAAKKHVDNLPGRHQSFQVPNGPRISGKAVRKAVLDAHVHLPGLQKIQDDNRNGLLTKSQYKKRVTNMPLKNFGNSDHREPHPGNPTDVKSINHMTGAGHEYPIGSTTKKGPARVITQQQGGRTRFMGVVAHDVTRTKATHPDGYNDHFQVHPTR